MSPERGDWVAILIVLALLPPALAQAVSTMLATTSNVSIANKRLAIFTPPIEYAHFSHTSGSKPMNRQGESCPHHLLCMKMAKLFVKRLGDNKKSQRKHPKKDWISHGSKMVNGFDDYLGFRWY
jgi:rhamnose utilization protein RhaD (predicted bifunctional aldolase and dehydrogenase)